LAKAAVDLLAVASCSQLLAGVVVGEIVFITVVFSLGIGIDWNVTRWYMLGVSV
jgi:hypothetical protein